MTRDVATLGSGASAAEAWNLCQERSIRHLPVVDDGRLVGLVSDRDLRDVSAPRGSGGESNTLSWTRLGDIMSTRLATIGPLETVDHAARELHDRKIGCLPVVDGGELVGIITSSDMMQTLMEILGARGRRGSWIEIEVPNEPGQLANVTDVIRDRKVNIGGVFLSPADRASHRLIVLRLETTNPSGTARTLEEAGYKTTTVRAPSQPEPTLEES